MTTRERAIEAAAWAMLDFTLEEWVDREAAATAALDALLDTLGEPGEEMVEAGAAVLQPDTPATYEKSRLVLRAMLATLRKEG